MGKKAYLPYTFEFLGVNEAKFISFTPLPHHPNMALAFFSSDVPPAFVIVAASLSWSTQLL